MALNEAATHFSNLTETQRREAEAAIYGLPNPQPIADDLSAEDIARMRMILARHDAQQSPVREFDLNRPPRVETLAPGTPGATGPYQYQAFPRVLYDHERRAYRVVQNQVQMDQMLALGYRIDPYPSEPPEEPELDAATQAEVAAIDAEARKKKAK